MKERERHHHDVTAPVTDSRSEIVSTLRLAMPLIGAQLASVAMGATDAAFLGRLGSDALAGGGLAASIHVTAQLVGSGFLTVVAPLAAHARARRDDTALANVTRHGLMVAVFLGVLAAVGVQHVSFVLRALGEPPAVIAAVDPFARMVAWSTPFMLASSVFRHVLTAAERPRIVAASTVGAAVANAALDALFIGRMGAAGIGLATTVVSAGACIFLAAAAGRIVPPRSVLRLDLHRATLRDLIQLGAPAAIMIGAEVAVFQLAGLVVARDGTNALAAHQLALTVVTVTFVIPLGISQAVAVRVAAASAVGGPSNGRAAGRAGFTVGAAFASAAAGLLFVAPELIARLFIHDDVATLSTVVVILRIAAIFQLFDSAQVIAAGALRGLRDTKTPAAIAVAAYVIVAPAVAGAVTAAVTPVAVAVWTGLAVALACVAFCLVARFRWLTHGRP